jgi:RNA polymerase sigma factor (sigma-70 family)
MPAFEQSFPDLLRLAFRVARRIVGTREDAEDIAVETLARAALRWRVIEHRAQPWVVRVATNLAIDEVRRSRRRPPPGSALSPDWAAEADQRLDVADTLRQLPRRQRQVLVLRHYCGMTDEGIADHLRISVGSVKQHSSRAASAVRRLVSVVPDAPVE